MVRLMASHMLAHYILWIVGGSTLAVCILAWVRGGAAERYGAAMVVLTWTVVIAFQFAFANAGPSLWVVSVPMLICDFLLSFGLLVLALRFASLWVGAAMLAQSAQLGIQALFIADGGLTHHAFAEGSNICSGVLLAALLLGTLSSWRRRVVRRREETGATV